LIDLKNLNGEVFVTLEAFMLIKRLTNEELEKLFQLELVKHGVKSELAEQAAKILASGKSDELLTEPEILFVEQVCKQWLMRRKLQSRCPNLFTECSPNSNKSS